MVLNLLKIINSYKRSNPSKGDLSIIIRELQTANGAVKVIYFFNQLKIIFYAINSYFMSSPPVAKYQELLLKANFSM